jgi:hypothetical protein
MLKLYKYITVEHIKAIGIISIIVALFSLQVINSNNKYDEINRKVQLLEKQNGNLKVIIDSLNLEHNGYKEYLLRKKASNLSGVDIPDKFKYSHIKKVFEVCEKNNLPPRLLFRLIKAESDFRKDAISSAGAKGFFQIMPGTYRGYSRKLGIKKHNEFANIEVGAFYLKTLYKSFNKEKNNENRWRLTILSYNYGIGRVINNKRRFLGREFDNYNYLNYILS